MRKRFQQCENVNEKSELTFKKYISKDAEYTDTGDFWGETTISLRAAKAKLV